MIGRNDVTGTRDVKITHFPRSPWRSAVASSKNARDARLPHGWAVSSSCLSIFFFKKFQFPFLASLRFLFASATLTYLWQPTSVACRSASEVAPLLESSEPRVAHRSRRWRTQGKGGGEEKKEVHVSRERERNKQKPGVLVTLMWRFESCFSLTSRRAGVHAHEWKRNWETPFRFDQPHQAIIPCDLTRHDHCVHDCLPRRERQLVNSISDVETGLELSTASRQSTCLEEERSGDRMFVQTTAPSLWKKSRMATTWSGTKLWTVRSSRSTWKICWSNDSCRKLAECGLTGNNAYACTAAIASTVLHGNNAVNWGAVLTTGNEEESLPSIVVVRHSLEKNPARNVERLWNLAGIFLKHWRIVQT